MILSVAAVGLVASGIFSGWLPGLVGLSLALWFLMQGVSGIGLMQYLVLATLILSVPLSALLAGGFVDRYCAPNFSSRSFATLAAAMAMSLLLSSGSSFMALEQFLFGVMGGSGVDLLLTFCGLINSILLCGSMTALALMSLQCCVEIPVRWLQRSVHHPQLVTLSALRPLLILATAALLFHLIVSFFFYSLWPT